MLKSLVGGMQQVLKILTYMPSQFSIGVTDLLIQIKHYGVVGSLKIKILNASLSVIPDIQKILQPFKKNLDIWTYL